MIPTVVVAGLHGGCVLCLHGEVTTERRLRVTQRPCVYVLRDEPADGGVSPNAYKPVATVEIRVFWPPRDPAAAHRAFEAAVAEARARLDERTAG